MKTFIAEAKEVEDTNIGEACNVLIGQVNFSFEELFRNTCIAVVRRQVAN